MKNEVLFADEAYKKIIVEIKSVTKLAAEHHAQLFNYIKAANLRGKGKITDRSACLFAHQLCWNWLQ